MQNADLNLTHKLENNKAAVIINARRVGKDISKPKIQTKVVQLVVLLLTVKMMTFVLLWQQLASCSQTAREAKKKKGGIGSSSSSDGGSNHTENPALICCVCMCIFVHGCSLFWWWTITQSVISNKNPLINKWGGKAKSKVCWLFACVMERPWNSPTV